MSKTIEELEKELQEAKQKELQDKWEVYLNKCKDFLENIKGKTILQWFSNGGCIVYRVRGYTEQYYIERNGAYGQWSPSRWFEVITEKYLRFSVCDDKGHYYSPAIKERNQFLVFLKKGKVLVPEICVEDSTCSGEVKDLFKLGYIEYKDFPEAPSYDNALSRFMSFSQVVPDEVLDEALKIYEEHAQKTISFWERHKDAIKTSPRLDSFYKQ